MDIQSESVPRTMKESLHAATLKSRRKSFPGKIVHDFVVDVIGARSVANLAESDLLCMCDAAVCVFQSIGRASTNDRPGNIAEVSCFLRPREDVHNDGLVCSNRAAALVMGIH